jgi:heat shock protein HtpX
MNNQLKTVLLLGALSAVVIGFGSLVAPGALHLFVGLALAMNLGAYFFSDKLVLRMHGAHEVSREQAPELHGMVEELAVKAGIPMPRVCVIPDAQPNAFATGRNPANGVVAVTEGIVRVLDRHELRGVIAHELAHIKNRDILIASVAAAGASLIGYVANAVTWSALLGGGSSSDDEGDSGGMGGALLAAFVAPIVAMLIQFGISRSREYLADETGARLCGDPEALARALLKLERGADLVASQATPTTASLFIVNPFGATQGGTRWLSTHPATQERVDRLLAMAGRPARFAREG